MIDNPLYTREFHGDYDVVSIGRLDLEEGGTIPDCLLALTTWGELNEARDNAILITTWYSGTHQIWRDVYVGPRHALDPERTSSSRSTRSATACRSRRTTRRPRDRHVAVSRRFVSVTTSSRRNGCCASTSASSGSSSSSVGRWARSRPSNGRCGSRTRSAAPPRSRAPRRTRRTTSFSSRRCTSRSGPTRLERRRLPVQRRRRRRPHPARAPLGGDGLLHGVLEAGAVAGTGVRLEGAFLTVSSSPTSP